MKQLEKTKQHLWKTAGSEHSSTSNDEGMSEATVFGFHSLLTLIPSVPFSSNCLGYFGKEGQELKAANSFWLIATWRLAILDILVCSCQISVRCRH